MQIDLNNQVAIVTGSAHRVGRAIALALAKEGVHIVVHYNSAASDVVRDTMQDIRSLGVDAITVQANLAQPGGVATLFEAVAGHFGRLDILINSASVFPKGDIMDVTLESWQTTLDVNLTAPFLCTQAAVRMFRQRHPVSGCIINILDRGAVMPWTRRPHHGISKAGLWMLTQTCAMSFAPDVRVNAIMPGPVMPVPGTKDEDWQKIGESHTLLRRAGNADDIGRAAVYLAREDFITGALLPVNGGEHLNGWDW